MGIAASYPPMTRSFFAFSLSVAVAFFIGACDQHSWEETSSLHGGHGDHDGGGHAEGHEKDSGHADGDDKKAEH